ncbi:MAG: hypothetical protein K6U14_07295 [Firmicutes bacterium]|nr:hypothetical protein [Alicyclobacillaceae bacterium]MCL6497423.1 hypothetical protein [Bacillota bacterium]
MTELARQGHPLALHFLEHYARPDPIPPASSPQPKAEAPDRSLADMVEAAHDLREELLAVMRETASRMRELQGAVEGLQRELNEVKSAVDRLIADDQRVGPLPDNFYSDFVNTLSAICRQFLLEKGEPGCGM